MKQEEAKALLEQIEQLEGRQIPLLTLDWVVKNPASAKERIQELSADKNMSSASPNP